MVRTKTTRTAIVAQRIIIFTLRADVLNLTALAPMFIFGIQNDRYTHNAVIMTRKKTNSTQYLGFVSKGTWFRIIKQASLSHWVAEYNLKVSGVNYQKPRSPSKQHPNIYYNASFLSNASYFKKIPVNIVYNYSRLNCT